MMGSYDHFYQQYCVSCQSQEILVNLRAGDVICSNCGHVLQSRILDNGNEDIIHEDERGSKLSRVSGFGDSFGQQECVYLAGGTDKMRKQMERVQKSLSNKNEKSILRNLPGINEMCSNLQLSPSVKETAVHLFIRVCSEKLLVVNKPAIAATCVFLACRLVGCPRLAEEIAAGCSSHSFFTQASSHRQQPLQQPSLSSSALAVIDVSTLHRMQTELLKALQIAPRITKSADLFLRLSSRVLQEISGLQHQHQQRQQRQQQQFRQEASQPQRHISLSYATLEEGVSLCERIASFEVLPEHTPPQTIVAAVLVWLLVLLPEVADRPADHRSSSSLAATSATTCTTVTSPAHSSPTSDGNDKSSAVNVSAPPLENVGAFWSLPTIASHCYTSVKAVKDLVGRLHSALPILFLCNDNPGHNEAAGDNSTRARLAKAYEQFNVSLAAQSLQLSQPSHSLLKENVTQDDTDNTSHINSTNKRKRGNNHSGGSSSSFQVDCIIDPVTHSLHSPLWLLPVAPSSTKGRAPSSHPANAASVFPIPPSFASSAIGSNNCSSSGSSHAKSVVSMSAETPSVGVPKTPSTQSLCSQTTETSFQSESNNDNGNLRSSFGSNHQSRLFAKRAQEIARQSQGLFAPERKRLRYS